MFRTRSSLSLVMLIVAFSTTQSAAAGAASASYRVSHRVLDQGGGQMQSSGIRMTVSLGGPGGISRVSQHVLRHGYAGQLNEAPRLSLIEATNITRTNATARAGVHPNGLRTATYVEFGATASYGNVLVLPDIEGGFGLQQVSALLPALSPGATYHFRVVAGNADGIVAGANVTFSTITNLPPFAQPDFFSRWPGALGKVTLSTLVANDFDPEGDPFHLKSFTPNSANGGSVVIESGWFIYTPPPGFDGTDRFTYTIEDPFGATASATVTVLVFTPISQRQDGMIVVIFAGVPERQFLVQWTDRLTSPIAWIDGPVFTASSDGLIEYVDDRPPSTTGQRFYRSVAVQP
jgi:hypothetical protein